MRSAAKLGSTLSRSTYSWYYIAVLAYRPSSSSLRGWTFGVPTHTASLSLFELIRQHIGLWCSAWLPVPAAVVAATIDWCWIRACATRSVLGLAQVVRPCASSRECARASPYGYGAATPRRRFSSLRSYFSHERVCISLSERPVALPQCPRRRIGWSANRLSSRLVESCTPVKGSLGIGFLCQP